MTGNELIELFRQAGKRCLAIGDATNGVIVGLDLEGRLYTVMDGTVMNRVNPVAVNGISTRAGYLNPGGDGLWPAPEGTCAGYQYSTGGWRVSPGLTGARFLVTEQHANHARIEAEIDLVNAVGIGIPTLFGRDVTVSATAETLTVKVIETIRYLGAKSLRGCLLAPWSLCQFDCGPGCEVVFPADNAVVWDLYDPSENCRYVKDGLIHTRTDGSQRYQIGIGKNTPWIELRKPQDNLIVRRSALSLTPGQDYIDIVDAAPTIAPQSRDTRYSVYSDMNGFMEIEAVGGDPDKIEPGMELSVEIITKFEANSLIIINQ